MQDTLLKKTIKIVNAETKQMSNGKYMTKIKDENGDSYTLFHLKMDGSESKAFSVFKTLPVSWIDSIVEISFKEEEYVREWKTYKSRKIVLINPKLIKKESEGAIKLNDWDVVSEDFNIDSIPF